ncbi:T9SS type B sorting domain-containing protein [Labilibaculum euxinus]
MLKTLLHKTLLTAIAILLGGWAVVAQQYVVKGTTLNFKVDEVTGYEYHWSVTHTSSGSVAYLASKTFESGDYVFADEGDYEVKVYPEDLGTHCFGDPLTMIVVVDGAAPTAEFDDLEVPYVCSANNGGDANGKVNITVNYNGPKPWTFKISVDRAPAVMPAGAEELYVNTFEFELEIPNTTGKTHRAEILLVEAKTLSGIPVTEDLANQTLEVDVMALPNTLFGDYTPVIQAGTIQSYTATIEKNENYELFVPGGATVLNEKTKKLSDKFHSELSFDVQWGNTPGDYQIKLLERTAFDCAGDTIYAAISVVESFVVSLGGDIQICEGESASLTPAIDFDGTYTYLWSDGSTGSSLSVTETGTYSVTATDSETGKSSSATVNVNVLTAPVVDLGADYELADAETKVLDAGNPGLTYSWSTGETSQTISVNNSNTYSVNVISLNGCVGTDEIIISSASDVFAIDLGADKNICDGEEVILNPNPSISQNYAYLWSNGAGTSTLTVSESGIYSVTVRDDEGNEKTDEIEVIVHALPIVDLGGDITLYDGETTTLDAGVSGSGLVYEWSSGESTQTISVSEENVYSVKVTDEYSCYNTDDISVVRKDGHKFSVDLGGDIQICEGDRVYLEPIIDRTFTSDPIYKWIPSESTEKGILVNQSGKYCVDVTDPFGNTEGDCIELTVNPSPIVDLGEDLIVQTGENVTLDAENNGSFYRWSTDDISQTINVSQAGEYWVEVTNQQSCMGRDTINVIYPEGDQFVGLASGFSPNGDGKNDVLFVRGNNIGSMNLIIYNRLGHKIFQSNRQDVGWDGTYRGVKQDMDVYVFFLQVTFLDGSSVQKRGNVTLLY